MMGLNAFKEWKNHYKESIKNLESPKGIKPSIEDSNDSIKVSIKEDHWMFHYCKDVDDHFEDHKGVLSGAYMTKNNEPFKYFILFELDNQRHSMEYFFDTHHVRVQEITNKGFFQSDNLEFTKEQGQRILKLFETFKVFIHTNHKTRLPFLTSEVKIKGGECIQKIKLGELL